MIHNVLYRHSQYRSRYCNCRYHRSQTHRHHIQLLDVQLHTVDLLAIEKSKSDTCNVISELDKCKKDLTDLSKPKLTSQQYEAIHQAVEAGIGEFDFDDSDNYSIDFGIDYDGRVHCESFCFDNATDLEHNIIEKLEELFAVQEEDTSDNSQLNIRVWVKTTGK